MVPPRAASSVEERSPHTREVVGSTPTPPTTSRGFGSSGNNASREEASCEIGAAGARPDPGDRRRRLHRGSAVEPARGHGLGCVPSFAQGHRSEVDRQRHRLRGRPDGSSLCSAISTSGAPTTASTSSPRGSPGAASATRPTASASRCSTSTTLATTRRAAPPAEAPLPLPRRRLRLRLRGLGLHPPAAGGRRALPGRDRAVLRPGGRALLTFFLAEEPAWRLRHSFAGALVADPALARGGHRLSRGVGARARRRRRADRARAGAPRHLERRPDAGSASRTSWSTASFPAPCGPSTSVTWATSASSAAGRSATS